MDGIFPSCLLDAVAQELPQKVDKRGCVLGATRCFHSPKEQGKSQITHETEMGKATLLLFATLRSPAFVRWLEEVPGVTDLRPDLHYSGSGVHLTGPAWWTSGGTC